MGRGYQYDCDIQPAVFRQRFGGSLVGFANSAWHDAELDGAGDMIDITDQDAEGDDATVTGWMQSVCESLSSLLFQELMRVILLTSTRSTSAISALIFDSTLPMMGNRLNTKRGSSDMRFGFQKMQHCQGMKPHSASFVTVIE